MKYAILILLSMVIVSASASTDTQLIQKLAQNAKYNSAKLSPDGKKLSVVINAEGRRRLVVFDLDSFKVVGGANAGAGGEVGSHFWVNDERIVMQVLHREPWRVEPQYYGELAAVNFDGSQPSLIYGYRAGGNQTGSRIKGKESTKGWAEVLHYLPDDERHILISSTKVSRDGRKKASVHKLNVYNGKLSRPITKSPVTYSTFITDWEGEVRFAVGIDSTYTRRAYLRDDEAWKEITGEYGDSFFPLAFDETGTKLFYIDQDDNQKQSLYSLNIDSGVHSIVYADERVDVSEVSFSADGSNVYAVRVDDGYPTYVLFNSKNDEAQVFKSLLSTFQGYKISITSRSYDNNKMLIYVSNDIDAGSYYLFDRKANKLSALFSNFSDVDINQMATSTPFNFESFDGQTVQGYITYPVDVDQSDKVPLITLVHGGPNARDYWLFDPQVQMLAAQGYAVVRVNFRGSTGYGNDFQHAGDKHWGDHIQQDIIAGTRYILDQGRINPDKVCIMGASFGGYSAVMSPILAPDLYKCAVAHVGVYDLTMMAEEGDIPESLFGEEFVKSAIGEDPAMLKQFSPVYNAEKLMAPVFIAHGKKDRRVPFEHAERLKEALDEHNKPYEWFVKSSESHGFFNEENRAEYFEKVSEFLAEHLD